ncbi:MAG: BamA/TamA family outer membrane protein [Holosporales bacterium]|jgi:translocation and assembly module TamA|nr:BamA/TamA family outer membrane protein [Holosporales bacterium]
MRILNRIAAVSFFIFYEFSCLGGVWATQSVFECSSRVKRKAYKIEYVGVPSFIGKEFEKTSILVRDQKKGIASKKSAIKSIRYDKGILKQLFLQYGFFDAQIKAKMAVRKGIIILFECIPGERYKVLEKNISFTSKTHAAEEFFQNLQKAKKILQISKGEYVNFLLIEFERNYLQQYFKKEGYFFAIVEVPILDLNTEHKTANIVYEVTPGQRAVISQVDVSGEQKVPKKFILNRASFTCGDILKSSAIENAQMNIVESGLFSNVNISATKGTEKDRNSEKVQEALVNIDVTECLPRVIGAGLYYSASEGWAVAANWQNKNFQQRCHNIGALAHIGQKEKSSMFFYTIPDAFRPNQKVHCDVTAKHFDTKAYKGDKISVTAGIIQTAQVLDHCLELSLLPTFEHGKLTRKSSYEQSIGGVKSSIKLNLSNHRVYPTKGAIFNVEFDQYFGRFAHIIPATDLEKEHVDVNKNVNTMSSITCTASGYVPFSKQEKYGRNAPVLALFLKVGSTIIKDLEYIPFDKRFYGGGRNLVRSYGYQMSGDLESDGTPIGGASIVEACIEPRIRISQDFGAVVFLDYSCILEDNFPRLYKSGHSNAGCGIGLRYFTQFGPIRFDLGFPFKRRSDINGKKIDNSVQFYISVGQAF